MPRFAITDHADNGSFHGWIQAPANLTKAGPLETGDHWLRILTGVRYETTTGDGETNSGFGVVRRSLTRVMGWPAEGAPRIAARRHTPDR